eukprot:gene31448-40488_t
MQRAPHCLLLRLPRDVRPLNTVHKSSPVLPDTSNWVTLIDLFGDGWSGLQLSIQTVTPTALRDDSYQPMSESYAPSCENNPHTIFLSATDRDVELGIQYVLKTEYIANLSAALTWEVLWVAKDETSGQEYH